MDSNHNRKNSKREDGGFPGEFDVLKREIPGVTNERRELLRKNKSKSSSYTDTSNQTESKTFSPNYQAEKVVIGKEEIGKVAEQRAKKEINATYNPNTPYVHPKKKKYAGRSKAINSDEGIIFGGSVGAERSFLQDEALCDADGIHRDSARLLWCRACETTIADETDRGLSLHRGGRKHLKNLRNKNLEEDDDLYERGGGKESAVAKMKPDSKKIRREERLNTRGKSQLYCKWCDKPLTSNVNAKDHFGGKRHRAVMEDLGEEEWEEHDNYVKTFFGTHYCIAESLTSTARESNHGDSLPVVASAPPGNRRLLPFGQSASASVGSSGAAEDPRLRTRQPVEKAEVVGNNVGEGASASSATSIPSTSDSRAHTVRQDAPDDPRRRKKVAEPTGDGNTRRRDEGTISVKGRAPENEREGPQAALVDGDEHLAAIPAEKRPLRVESTPCFDDDNGEMGEETYVMGGIESTRVTAAAPSTEGGPKLKKQRRDVNSDEPVCCIVLYLRLLRILWKSLY